MKLLQKPKAKYIKYTKYEKKERKKEDEKVLIIKKTTKKLKKEGRILYVLPFLFYVGPNFVHRIIGLKISLRGNSIEGHIVIVS